MSAARSFEVLGRVAATASGSVWKARDRALDRLVALKEIGAPDEAAALAAVSSPHVVAVYGVVADGARTYLVEEWVEGATLAALLRASGRLDTAQALGVMRGALLGLAAVHRAGLVHGDLSASNVLVDAAGAAKVIDFGSVARAGASVRPATGAFAAPELLAGSPAGAASDVYAAAAVLATLLHGRTERRPSTRGVDQPVRGVLDRALDAEPAARYPDAAAFLAALEDAATRRYGPSWWTQSGLGALATGASGSVLAAGADAPFGDAGSVAASGAKRAETHPDAVALVGEEPHELRAGRRPRRAWLVGAALVVAALVGLAVVLARGGGGAKQAAEPKHRPTSAATTSTTPGGTSAAPAAGPDAAFTGSYAATQTIMSLAQPSAFLHVGGVSRRSWQVSAHCASGACSADVRITGGGIARVAMHWTGKAWTGSVRRSGEGIVSTGAAWMQRPVRAATCGGVPANETVEYTVTGAGTLAAPPETLHGRIVDRIVGACLDQRVTYALTLTRTR